MAKRITLTIREIDALLATSGDVDAEATFENHDCSQAERERLYDAWESGREKLFAMLEKRQSRRKKHPT